MNYFLLYSFRLRLKWQNDHSKAFLKLGFTELNGKPKWVVCLKVLSAESMKKNKLQRHLELEFAPMVQQHVLSPDWGQ